jgi:hypothetical protein
MCTATAGRGPAAAAVAPHPQAQRRVGRIEEALLAARLRPALLARQAAAGRRIASHPHRHPAARLSPQRAL